MKRQGTKIIHRKHHKKLFMKRRVSKQLHQQRLALKVKTCMYVLGSLILKFYSKQKVCTSRLILQQVILKLKLPIKGKYIIYAPIRHIDKIMPLQQNSTTKPISPSRHNYNCNKVHTIKIHKYCPHKQL